MKHRFSTILAVLFLIMPLQACNNQPQYLTPQEGGKTGDTDDGSGTAKPVDADPFTFCNLVGVDQFGRTFDTVGGIRDDRQVGLFFWLWIGQPYASGVYDATKILALPNGLKLLTDLNSLDPAVSPDGQQHWWGEPLWGYYNSDDEWVLRKQLQMISMAGVDFIFFDHTNTVVYDAVMFKVCKIIDEMQKQGWNPPKVVSYTHSRSIQTTRKLYEVMYKPGRYPDTWYRVDGKPLIIAYTDPADDIAEAVSRNDTSYNPGELEGEIRDFFHFFKPNWPSDPSYPDGFTWVEWKFPQPLHAESGMMNVTVASHPGVPMSFSLTRPGHINWGRGWDPVLRQNISSNVDKGTFFQAQWDEAIKASPSMISVGGWNEWIAYKQPYGGEYMLCDAANKEYSRDIEPMKGGYEDAFYLQLVKNIRRYKCTESSKAHSQRAHTIDIDGDVSQWDEVGYAVRNTDGAFMARNNYGNTQKVHYAQPAPVDKLTTVKVAHDASNIYFYIEGKDDFSKYSGKTNWLNVLIGCGDPAAKAWECYDYVAGMQISGKSASVHKISKGYTVSQTGKADIRISGKAIRMKIPRSAVGMTALKRFYFKVEMGVEDPSDIMSSYLSGSAIPMGRLSYMYDMN